MQKNGLSERRKNGDRLVGYMEGHGYLLGHKDGKLYRGDLCYGADDIYWETYTLYDTIEDKASPV